MQWYKWQFLSQLKINFIFFKGTVLKNHWNELILILIIATPCDASVRVCTVRTTAQFHIDKSDLKSKFCENFISKVLTLKKFVEARINIVSIVLTVDARLLYFQVFKLQILETCVHCEIFNIFVRSMLCFSKLPHTFFTSHIHIKRNPCTAMRKG